MFTPLLIAARTAHIGASILLAGIFTFDAIILSPGSRVGTGDFQEVERRLLRLAVWSLIAAILSGLLWFWLEVASMNELSLKNALSAPEWRAVLFETRFGRVWQLRFGVIVAAFPLIWLCRAQVKARRALILILWLLSVVVLVVSGISNSWLLVGSFHALFATAYGRLLLFKLALFGILIVFGARNRFLIKAKLVKTPADKDLLPQLRRNVICEACFGAAVVAIVACL